MYLSILFFVFYRTLYLVTEVIEIMLVARAILSFFPNFRLPYILSRILFGVTDFCLSPVRKLIGNISFVRRCPFDLSYIAVYVIVHFVQVILASAYYMFLY